MELNKVEERMEGAVEALQREFAGLRSGRVSASMLDPIQVDAYGSFMPLNQVGNVGVPEPRLLTVQVWDQGMVAAVEKALRNSDLGLNPQTEGNLIRVPVPPLSTERRAEIVKIAGKYSEQARVSVRNVRRDAMDDVKKQQKAGDISEDEQKAAESNIQDLTNVAVKKIDDALAQKEKDMMSV